MRSATVVALLAGAASAIMALIHCGSRTGQGEAGQDGGQQSEDLDAGICGSPSGYVLCGGPNACFLEGGPPCDLCTLDQIRMFDSPYDLGLCDNKASPSAVNVETCDDDCVYIETFQPTFWSAFPLEVGVLFAANGAEDRVRYADLSFYTGQPLPEIASCTAPGSFTVCGGTCPPCAADRICTGRSPLHPLGLCVLKNQDCQPEKNFACPAGDGCFVFSVQADAQALANEYGECMPLAECQAAAKSYQGGGVCHPPQ
jgi:hypothetical protein